MFSLVLGVFYQRFGGPNRSGSPFPEYMEISKCLVTTPDSGFPSTGKVYFRSCDTLPGGSTANPLTCARVVKLVVDPSAKVDLGRSVDGRSHWLAGYTNSREFVAKSGTHRVTLINPSKHLVVTK